MPMSRRCTICIHPERAAIDRALVAEEPFRDIAERCAVSTGALVRHKQAHLPAHLAQAKQEEEAGQALDIVRQLRAINVACLEVLKKARANGQDGTLLRAVDRIHRQIELQARLLGDIQEGATVNVLVAPEWHQVRQVILISLAPYPEARTAVAQALRSLPDALT
jgi:hypothetical protein